MQDTFRIMGAHRPFEPPPLPFREKEQRPHPAPAPDEEEPPIDPDKEGLVEPLDPSDVDEDPHMRTEPVCGKTRGRSGAHPGQSRCQRGRRQDNVLA